MLTYVLIQVCLNKIDFKRLRKFGLRVKKTLVEFDDFKLVKSSGLFGNIISNNTDQHQDLKADLIISKRSAIKSMQ
jgi:hypothetical protein